MTVDIRTEIPSAAALVKLYGSVGWSAYTNDADRLVGAVAASYLVFTAWSADGTLVGLARSISDGLTVAYLQDILVAPQHRRSGIGGALLDAVIGASEGIRQLVLLTDDEARQRAFYESRGFVEAHDVMPHPLRSFVRLR